MQLLFQLKRFETLGVIELYEIMKLRSAVFVVEQNCPYLDLDDKDQQAYHLMGFNTNGDLIAYLRMLAPGVSYNEASIGRVLVKESERKNHLGIQLMQKGIEETCRIFETSKISISAQFYLLRFYESLGFKAIGEVYLEDDIPHIKMIYGNF